MNIHYGGGWVGSIYQIAVAGGLIWLVITGTLIYLRGVRRSRRARRGGA